MKIAITGSNGIIGRQLFLQLSDFFPDAEFLLINRSKGSSESNSRVTNIEVDILKLDHSQADLIFKNFSPEILFHLAWDTGHSDYLNTSDNDIWDKKSIILIDSFYKAGGKRFVGVGSSIEYDWTSKSPFHEDSSPVTGNKWKYGHAKLNVYKHLTRIPGASFLWCRVFFVFGPGQSKTRLVPLIINQAINGGTPLTINVHLRRDYISTFEIARQMILMLQTDYSGAVNICSGRTIALKEIINCVESCVGKQVSLQLAQYQDNFEIEQLGGSIDLIKHYYPGYEYSMSRFIEDIQHTIDQTKF